MRHWLIALLTLVGITTLKGEGTRELRPTSATQGELNPWDWGGEFATYDAPAERRLNVRIKDHATEKIFLGFQSLYTGKTYMRIKNPNGAVVYGPIELKKWGSNPGFIFNYAAAVAGPKKLNAAGYVPVRFDPTMNGDYVIELNTDSASTKVIRNVRYALFDISVVDTVNLVERKGRTWSKLWAMTTASPSNQFAAKMYVLRSDSIRFEVNYNGIKPHGFGIVSNSWGVTNTNNPVVDRRSSAPSYTQGTVVFVPEHMIFLNPPDTTVFPFPKVLPSVSLPDSEYEMITGCISTGYCFNLRANKGGTTEILLSLDGVPGYQAGGRDRKILGNVQKGENCVYWDGYDGLGDTALSATVQINYKYEAGLIHIPIYDAEEHPNGYVFRLLDNSYTSLDTLPLFWDDIPLGGTFQDSGCVVGPGVTCRAWINNYGNERFMNTWSFAYDQQVVFSALAFQYCAPVAKNDTVVINQGDTITFFPIGNDFANNGALDLFTFSLLDSTYHGGVTFDPLTGALIYAPSPQFYGKDSLRYTICDNASPSGCANGWIYFTVIDINVPPSISGVGGSPAYGGIAVVQPVLEEDTLVICFEWEDYDGDIPAFSGFAPAPLNGTVIGWTDGDSCLMYVPNSNFNGNDTIAVVICDNGGPQPACDTIYVPINVGYVNDPPFFDYAGSPTSPGTLNPIDTAYLSIPEDSALRICWHATDPENQGGSLAGVTIPTSTIAQYVVDPITTCVWYVPEPNFNGLDTVILVYCDNGTPSLCDTLVIVVDVLPVNDPPQAIDDGVSVDPGDTVFVNMLLNDFDLEDTVFTINLISFPSKGTAVVIGNQIRYIANPGTTVGIDTFSYRICDLGWPIYCDEAKVVVGIPAGEHPPLAQNDFYITQEDVAKWCYPVNNDVDVNLDSLNITWFSGPSHGTALLVNNAFLYTPFANYYGVDTIQYTVCDNTPTGALCDTALVIIQVLPMPDPPALVNPVTGVPIHSITINVFEDIPQNLCLNLVDPDNQPVDITQNILGAGGASVSGFNDGDSCILYTSALNYSGTDTLQLVICDGGFPSTCDTILVYLNILPTNDPPVAYNDTALTLEATPLGIQVTNNDNDVLDNGSINNATLSVLSGPWNGSATLAPGGYIVYTPNAGFSGMDSLQYQICDNGNPLPAACTSAWVYIQVDPSNKKPVAVNDQYSVLNNGTLALVPVLNDFDPDGNDLIVSILTGPFNGTIVGSGLNTYLYTPNSTHCGEDSIQYQLCDNGVPSLCDTAWMKITINPADSDLDGLSNQFETLTANTDQDAQPDYLDVDSDNDGIGDAVEAQVSGPTCNQNVLDFDGDGTPDHLDMDSDNDGIADWIERATVIRAPLNRDLDGDGIDDAYDPTYGGHLETNPVDTDGDGIPDYHDLDSDNDGIPDWLEGNGAGVPPTGFDSDGDGIDDAYDTSSGGEGVEQIPVDTDLDGVPDFRDIDSDNDGFPDGSEGAYEDCNENGIPDYRDPIGCDLVVPEGISPNGDGINDTWVIDQLYRYPNHEVEILNRWGQVIFKASPYSNDWSGQVNESSPYAGTEIAPAGTYFYIIKLGPGLPTLNGYIYLKR